VSLYNMQMIQTILFVVNVLSALGVIVLVLMQHGKGADMGAAFGSGSAGSLFGSAGSSNFLSRSTAVCAIIFFATCFALAVMLTTKKSDADLGVMGSAPVASAVAPVAPVASGPAKIPD
jgi:preprotein translocase subunit SecG